MIDALTPAVETLNESVEQGVSIGEGLKKSAEAAETGMKSTIPLVARKGRASYLGERSAGTRTQEQLLRSYYWIQPQKSGQIFRHQYLNHFYQSKERVKWRNMLEQ